MPPTLTTFWITKNALTKGIQREDDCDLSNDGKYVTRGRHGQPNHLYASIGKEAFKSEEEARVRAIELAKSKLAGIEREKDKLEDLIAEWSPIAKKAAKKRA